MISFKLFYAPLRMGIPKLLNPLLTKMPFRKVFLNTGTKKLKSLLEITNHLVYRKKKISNKKIVYYPHLVIFHLFIAKAALF